MELKNSMLGRNFGIIKENVENFAFILLFDFLFIVAMYYLGVLRNVFVVPMSYISILYFLFFVVVFIAAYSVFKYLALDYLRSVWRKDSMGFSNFKRFFLLNLCIILPSFIVISFLNFLGLTMLQGRILGSILFLILLLLLVVYVYTLLNIAHSIFARKHEFYNVLKDALRKSVNPSLYAKTYAYDLLFIIAFVAVWLIAKAVLLLIGYSAYISYYAYYRTAIIVLLFIALYAIIDFNRISFYISFAGEKKEKN